MSAREKAPLVINPVRLMLEWAVLLALAIGGALYSQASGLTGRIDNQLLDLGATLARAPVDEDIVIVTIDDPSLAEIGAWPWRRDVHARLIDQLEAGGARLIVLDVLFPDPSEPEADAALAKAIERSGAVFLPHSFTARLNARRGVDPLWPLPALRAASAGVGHVVAEPDADGVLRRFDLALATDTGVYPHLAALALGALGEETSSAAERTDTVIVPFHPEARLVRQPAAEVLAGSTAPGFFDDRIVLIGATAQGLGDRFSVAAGSVELMSGIGAQANLLAALRAGTLITPASQVAQAVIALIMILALFLAFWHLPPRYVLVCALGVLLAVLLGSMALLAGAQLWFAPGSIMVVVILAYPLWSWRRLSHVSRYLDREAARLMPEDAAPASGEGLDYVTAQVEQLRRLIRTVRGSLSFLQQVIEAAPDAIVVLDRDGAVEMLNEKAAGLFPDWRTYGGASFSALLLASGARLDKEGSELVDAKGRTLLVARAEIASDERGEQGGEIIALRDVSALRKLDDERKQMLEFLSHDMRTPQVAIVGLTQEAESVGADSDTVARIRAQAQRTLKLADDFVQLARLESPSLAVMDSDIGALIEEASDRAYTLAQAKRIRIDQALPQEPCFAAVDPSMIARLLDNLIGNAIKYSGEGSNICVSLADGPGERFTMVVEDEGTGLSKERQADPFSRFGAHDAGAGPSVGLGLAFVKKVVDLHGGSISVRSRTGEGTSFTIALPRGLDPH